VVFQNRSVLGIAKSKNNVAGAEQKEIFVAANGKIRRTDDRF